MALIGSEKWLGILLMADDAVLDQLIALSMAYSLILRRTRFAR